MASDNDPQQEILLGNKQLLSIFFIVVLLLGVSFTIGYMIGKNTASVSAAGINGPAVTTSTGSIRPPAAASSPRETENPTAPATAAKTEEPPATPPVAAENPAPERAAGTRPAQPYEEPAAKRAGDEQPASTDGAVQPQAGTGAASYLQVAALKREDADHIVKVLRQRGYPALLGESPKEGLFRVLVGPFQTTPELAESKQKLKASGFDSIVAR